MSLVKPLAAAINKSTASSLTGLIGTDSGTSEVVPTPVNLIPEVDFTQWKQSGVYGMTEVTKDSFTNKATSSVAFDIGAEAGETYLVSFTMDRGAGALRVYISEEGTITNNDDVHDVTTGQTSIEVVASGPWFTFRASVGNTTTTVSDLKVYKKIEVPTVDVDAQIQSLISSLKSAGDLGLFYAPQPTVLGQQALFQDSTGSVPVTADGDPVGMLVDLSGAGNHAVQSTSAARPEYSGLFYAGAGQFLETGMPVDTTTYGDGFLWCFWIKWDSLESNTGSNGGVYQAPRLYVQMNGGGTMRVAVGDNLSPLVNGIEVSTWTHIAVAFNGSLVSAYKDGVLDTTMGASFTGDTVETFKIGQGFGLDREMNGSIGSQFLLAGLPSNYQDLIEEHIRLGTLA